MSRLGKDVDIGTRIQGATKALEDLGIVENLNKTRLGIDALKAPKVDAANHGPYTTSGTLLNPKVASTR